MECQKFPAEKFPTVKAGIVDETFAEVHSATNREPLRLPCGGAWETAGCFLSTVRSHDAVGICSERNSH